MTAALGPQCLRGFCPAIYAASTARLKLCPFKTSIRKHPRHRVAAARIALMKILLCSYAFAPSLGGIETVSKVLADEFCRMGSTVTVATYTPGPPMEGRHKIQRRLPFGKLYGLSRHADVAWQNNISLNMLPALLAARRPVVVTHQTWITRNDGSRGWQDRIKAAVLPLLHNVAISKAIA